MTMVTVKEGGNMPKLFIGIDVSKFKHTCCIIDDQGEIVKESFDFNNNRDGFNLLITTIKSLSKNHKIKVGLESTGHYGKNLINFLIHKRFDVYELNPVLVARDKKSKTLRRQKNDHIDAKEIAIYMMDHSPKAYCSLDYTKSELKILSRRRYGLIHRLNRELNSLYFNLDKTFPEFQKFVNNPRGFNTKPILFLLKHYSSAHSMKKMSNVFKDKLRRLSHNSFSILRIEELINLAKESIGYTSTSQEYIIKRIVDDIENINAQVEEIEEKEIRLLESYHDPILSIKGIGPGYASTIVGEINNFHNFSHPDKLVAFAGLDVSRYQSGIVDTKGRMVKKGSSYLRHALMMAAGKVAIHEPYFGMFYAKKINEGKNYMVARSHVAKKLIRVIWSLETKNQKFNSQIA